MNNRREKVLQLLADNQINYEIITHPAVKTVEEMKALDIEQTGEGIKNLFLCDDKRRRFLLVSMPEDKAINLKHLEEMYGTRRLSFASSERLMQILDLEPGMVSPLGIINDDEHLTEVIFDKELKYFSRIGIHPNDNTATIYLKLEDLEYLIKKQGNSFTYLELE